MREAFGDLWDLVQPTEAIVITTNGTVTKEGRGVMGRGVAFQAKTKIKGIERLLGDYITRDGNHAWYLARGSEMFDGPQYGIIFMPVKHNWWEKADPELIVRSAQEMVVLADREQHLHGFASHTEWANIYMGRPGCGNGKLRWEDVKPLLDPILDDRFIAVTYDGG
jgi:hypothetical protein